MMAKKLLAAFTFSAVACLPDIAQATLVCEKHFISISREIGVPLQILYAVALTESSRKGKLQPLALNVAGRGVFPKSVAQAMLVIKRAQRRGISLIDVGCMQINIRYHRHKFRSLEHMFQPRSNIEYGARFLRQLKRRHGSWTLAIARYHAGPNNNFAQRRYVCAAIRNMIRAGMGRWTRKAREFCYGNKG